MTASTGTQLSTTLRRDAIGMQSQRHRGVMIHKDSQVHRSLVGPQSRDRLPALNMRPEITARQTPFNRRVLDKCTLMQRGYSTPAFLFNEHMETIWAAYMRVQLKLDLRRDYLMTGDGGVMAVDTFAEDDALPQDAPVAILFAGLAGGSTCSYVKYCIQSAHNAGIRSIVVNGRGTASSPVYTAQFYSASFTEDVRLAVNRIRADYPNALLFAIGWSLGSNILVNYLAEEGNDCVITAAASLCNPFDLVQCDRGLKEGFFGKVYDWNLAKSMVAFFSRHVHLFDGFDVDRALSARTVRDFDDVITRVTFGWKSVDDYYNGSSCCYSIHKVGIPLLCIQSADDPICLASSIPRKAIDANDNCILTVTPRGGHLGWVTTDNGIFGPPWTNEVVLEYILAINEIYRTDKHPSNKASVDHVNGVHVRHPSNVN